MKKIDLHGYSHTDAINYLTNELIIQYNEGNLPILVITGNSYIMKSIVYEVCSDLKLDVRKPLDNNNGTLVIQ